MSAPPPRRRAVFRGGLVSLGLAALVASIHCGARSDLAGFTEPGSGSSSSGSSSSGSDGSTGPPDSSSSGTTTPACKDAVLGSDPLGAVGLAVDGTDVYWSTVDGKLMKSSLDAPGRPLAEGLVFPNGVTVFGPTVYFTEQSRVLSVPKAGGAMSVVAAAQSLPMTVVADASGVWWLNRGQGILAGSVVTSLGGGATKTLYDQIDLASDMAMDATHLYFAATLAKANGQIVMGPLLRIPKASGVPELLAHDLHEPAGLTVDGSRVYWLEQVNDHSSFPGRLRALPTSGGAPVDVASTEDRLPVRVAVDDAYAYVTGLQGTGPGSHGVLWRVALGGGAVTELARTNGTVYGSVVVTATAVYFTIAWSQGAQPPGTASVRKLCK